MNGRRVDIVFDNAQNMGYYTDAKKPDYSEAKMKKKTAILLCICMLAAMLCACGAEPQTAETPAQDSTPAPEAAETEITEIDSVYAGNWYEKVAGRGRMEVTVSGENVIFNVIWADSAIRAAYGPLSAEKTKPA